MRGLVLMAGERQPAAGVLESQVHLSFSVVSTFLGGRERVAGPVLRE